MKKKGIIIGIVAIIAIVIGVALCNNGSLGDSVFQIKVSGTEGIEFSGSYLVTTADGQVISKSVDGIIPTQYSVTGMIVSVTFQKQTEEGQLKVEIIKDGIVIVEEDTTAAYGIVSIATE